MKKIPLTKGKFAIIDDEDYSLVSKYKWYYSHGYAVYKNKNILFMHRLILNTPKESYTDHINGDKLDNRRCNLRLCSKSQNGANCKKTQKKKTSSKYKGVCWDKIRKKWKASIKFNYLGINLGYFLNEQDAAKAYNEAAIKYFGEFAKLNKI